MRVLDTVVSYLLIQNVDMCISSSSIGSPDQTIQEILSLHGLGANDTVYKFTSAYTNSCIGPDPTEDIQILESGVQDHIDTIWRQMSQIDSMGRAMIIEKCGNADTFSDMLTGARNLAKLLTAIRRSLSSTKRSLECSLINPIYTKAAHDTICTSALTASVTGFLIFLLIAICVMVMITLRASWLRHIEEEKVYHDEEEIAENMVLDEHEEYLAYISRYKHEWQEYGGFEDDSPMGSDSYADGCSDEGSEYEDGRRYNGSYDGSEECSEISDSDLNSFEDERLSEAYQIHGTAEHATYVSDNISFPSLSGQKSEDDPHRLGGEDLFKVHPPLLPPPLNPELNQSTKTLYRRASEPPGKKLNSARGQFGVSARHMQKRVTSAIEIREGQGRVRSRIEDSTDTEEVEVQIT